MILYKRNAQNKPLFWKIKQLNPTNLVVKYGIVGGNAHEEVIHITKVSVNEIDSRVNAKRKEGYKSLSELRDNWNSPVEDIRSDDLLDYLDIYLPKYSTTSEGFVLPMLAKVLEDNKPFDKNGTYFGQWKINGLRCLIGAKETTDLFTPITLTYHSRTGEDWTNKMCWMDEILLPKLSNNLLDAMIEEGAYLDGELYIPGYPVNDINSFVKNPALKQHYNLQYWCYDVAIENSTAEFRTIFRENNIKGSLINFNTKEEHLNQTDRLVILPTFYSDSYNMSVELRNKFIDLGFEGLILRNPNSEYQFGKRNQAMFKFKKIDDGMFEILDIKEDKRGLPIYVLKNDINDELFEATINLTQEMQRNQLAIKQHLIGKKAFVEYRERSGVKQVPFHAKIIKVYV